jgi:hypothetical protein
MTIEPLHDDTWTHRLIAGDVETIFTRDQTLPWIAA